VSSYADTQKITDDERVLATVLYQRELCTQDTLAELFEVSRRTIGDVVREVGPILTQHGFSPTPAGTRFGTAAELLAALVGDEDLPTPPA
jgi:Helix-turn-helix of DDE superfamily endonuclease